MHWTAHWLIFQFNNSIIPPTSVYLDPKEKVSTSAKSSILDHQRALSNIFVSLLGVYSFIYAKTVIEDWNTLPPQISNAPRIIRPLTQLL